MTDVSEAMFSCDPCALSMRITFSEESVWQPARPKAAASAKPASVALYVLALPENRFDERDCFNVLVAMPGVLSPCVHRPCRCLPLRDKIKKAAANDSPPPDIHLKTSK